ncbi:dockerin type I repeat-containing protein [Acetivibrio cellulolyticus]|uniref:dockerin type I repeat-containing protein n=1 Tax=Acetivibrio cellulolyticus TaxID=35830 RepID=UPI0001E2CC75|nr:dockerin type I repeat-containing protein [Acetivibrio cellulolyticus]
MRKMLMSKVLMATVILGFIFLNVFSTSAAYVSQPEQDEDPLVKTLTIAFNSTCVGEATVEPADLNGQKTVRIGTYQKLKYNVGTTVYITNSTTRVRCADIYHVLSGESSLTVTMDTDKNVSFSYLSEPAEPSPSPTIESTPVTTPQRLKGDVDRSGTVNSIDFALFRQWLLGIVRDIDLWAADIDGDGRASPIDWGFLRQYMLGMRTTL